MKKLIFLDVDGTLVTQVDGHQYIPESALEAILEAKKLEHDVYLCTGRAMAEIGDLADIKGLTGIIGSAGGYVEKNGECIQSITFDSSLVIEAMNTLDPMNVEYVLECFDGLYCRQSFKDILRECVFNGEETHEYFNILHDLSLVDLSKVNKISFISQDTLYEDIINAVSNEFDTVRASWGPGIKEAGELMIKNLSKATAIQKVMSTYDDEVVTYGFGDSQNDKEMLEICNHPVVMGNYSHGIELYAEYITDTVLNDGIFKAFKHYELI